MNENQNQSKSEFPDELISAYLDGELSAEEKARVEEQLMDSAEHRQLFDELKAIRAGLQAIPSQSLDEEFAARVLERAEQQLLVGEGDAPTPRKKIATVAAAGSASSDPVAWRGLAWSVAAMAAAILLIVFSPMLREANDGPGNRPVAVNEPVERQSEANSRVAEERLLSKQHNAGEQRRKQAQGPLAKDNGVAEHPRSSSAPGLPPSPAMADGQTNKYDSRGRNGAESVSRGAFPGAAAPPIAQQQGQAQGGGAGHGFAAGRDLSLRPTAPPQVALSGGNTRGGPAQAPADGAFANRFTQFPESAKFRRLEQGETDATPALDALAKTGGDSSTSDMMVVSVDVTREALARQFMDELLQKHQIQTDPSQVALARQRSDGIRLGNRANEKSKQQLADQPSRGQQSAPAGAGAEGAGDLRDGRDGRDLASRRQRTSSIDRAELQQVTGDVDVMVVVATTEQINNLLGDLQSQSEDVLAMAYDRPIFTNQDEAKGTDLLKNHKVLGQQMRADPDLSAVADDVARRDKLLSGKDEQPQEKQAEQASNAGAKPSGKTADKDFSSQSTGQSADRSGDEEQFRGIARRLHLPEDFQQTFGEKRRAESFEEFGDHEATAEDERGAGLADANAGAHDRQEAAKIEALTTADDAAEKSRLEGHRKSEASQRLVRVLFVLRASGGDPFSPLADRIPASPLPANAALRESVPAEADAAAPPVDE